MQALLQQISTHCSRDTLRCQGASSPSKPSRQQRLTAALVQMATANVGSIVIMSDDSKNAHAVAGLITERGAQLLVSAASRLVQFFFCSPTLLLSLLQLVLRLRVRACLEQHAQALCPPWFQTCVRSSAPLCELPASDVCGALAAACF